MITQLRFLISTNRLNSNRTTLKEDHTISEIT